MTKKILITSGFLGIVGLLLFILVRVVFYEPVLNYFDFNTAIMLHLFHTLALLTFAFKSQYIREMRLKMVFYFFFFGIVFTCVPLYITHFTDPENLLRSLYNIIAFIGSGALIAGWIVVTYIGFAYHSKSRKK